ncbi:hypothetical protein ACFYXQ_44690 [Nocardia jiangxiensis]|uniref:HTH-like domain-containing protein n=1 Tax=Nocardia jiangxiensis TaxID=282685 RepID=A0ABW6SHH8_9NOCA
MEAVASIGSGGVAQHQHIFSNIRLWSQFSGWLRAPKVDRFEPVAAKYAEEWPAWGHRKIAALMRADGYEVSTSTAQRALRRRGLLLPQGIGRTVSRGRCCGARCSMIRRRNVIESGKPISANSTPAVVGSGGAAR